MRKASLFLIISASISVNYCIAQENESIDHVVYLIGNTATREINMSHLAGLSGHLLTENNPFSIIHLGDILQPGNLDDSYAGLDNFLNLATGNQNGQIYFTPGDIDWDNSGRDGFKWLQKIKEIDPPTLKV